jgi:predicted transcriptional regulator
VQRSTIHRIGLAVAALAASAMSLHAAAQAVQPVAASAIERNVRQEKRIEQGLKSGELSTQEAGRLQRHEAQVQRTQAKAMKDGQITAAEKQQITQRQNEASAAIRDAKHNDIKGDPNSASSQRMQQEVARDAHQQARIQQGLASGELTKTEAARMERQQARTSTRQAHAAADGHVSAGEHHRIKRSQNRHSRHIAHQKHDAQHALGKP